MPIVLVAFLLMLFLQRGCQSSGFWAQQTEIVTFGKWVCVGKCKDQMGGSPVQQKYVMDTLVDGRLTVSLCSKIQPGPSQHQNKNTTALNSISLGVPQWPEFCTLHWRMVAALSRFNALTASQIQAHSGPQSPCQNTNNGKTDCMFHLRSVGWSALFMLFMWWKAAQVITEPRNSEEGIIQVTPENTSSRFPFLFWCGISWLCFVCTYATRSIVLLAKAAFCVWFYII